MEVEVLNTAHISKHQILSFRAGGTRRQAQLQSLNSALKFPIPLEQCATLKVEVMDLVGFSRVPCNPSQDEYSVLLTPNGDSKDAARAMEVQFKLKAGNSMETDRVQAEKEARKEAAATDYLEEHNLVNFLQTLLHGLMKDKPEDPYRFLQREIAQKAAETLEQQGPSLDKDEQPPAAQEEQANKQAEQVDAMAEITALTNQLDLVGRTNEASEVDQPAPVQEAVAEPSAAAYVEEMRREFAAKVNALEEQHAAAIAEIVSLREQLEVQKTLAIPPPAAEFEAREAMQKEVPLPEAAEEQSQAEDVAKVNARNALEMLLADDDELPIEHKEEHIAAKANARDALEVLLAAEEHEEAGELETEETAAAKVRARNALEMLLEGEEEEAAAKESARHALEELLHIDEDESSHQAEGYEASEASAAANARNALEVLLAEDEEDEEAHEATKVKARNALEVLLTDEVEEAEDAAAAKAKARNALEMLLHEEEEEAVAKAGARHALDCLLHGDEEQRSEASGTANAKASARDALEVLLADDDGDMGQDPAAFAKASARDALEGLLEEDQQSSVTQKAVREIDEAQEQEAGADLEMTPEQLQAYKEMLELEEEIKSLAHENSMFVAEMARVRASVEMVRSEIAVIQQQQSAN